MMKHEHISVNVLSSTECHCLSSLVLYLEFRYLLFVGQWNLIEKLHRHVYQSYHKIELKDW